MSSLNTITFISDVSDVSISPTYGFVGIDFTIAGLNLEDATYLYFVDSFENEIQSAFTKVGTGENTTLQGKIPLLDGTKGVCRIKVGNSLGFTMGNYFEPWVASQTDIPNLSGDVTAQSTDRLAINSVISNTPNSNEGFQILSLGYTPVRPDHKLLIQSEVCLQSSFWGSAVLALYKDDLTTPQKVWNYGLMGYNLGQVAKLSLVVSAGYGGQQVWKLRVGRTPNTFPIIYINRDSNTATPYYGTPSSWMSITEIEVYEYNYGYFKST